MATDTRRIRASKWTSKGVGVDPGGTGFEEGVSDEGVLQWLAATPRPNAATSGA
jgi:hypothetical protein